jgi:hypothetical protein
MTGPVTLSIPLSAATRVGRPLRGRERLSGHHTSRLLIEGELQSLFARWGTADPTIVSLEVLTVLSATHVCLVKIEKPNSWHITAPCWDKQFVFNLLANYHRMSVAITDADVTMPISEIPALGGNTGDYDTVD